MKKFGFWYLKDSACANQLDCEISYFFQLHLMFHACVRRFGVTGTVQIFLRTKQDLNLSYILIQVHMVLKYIIYYLEKNFCKLFHFLDFKLVAELACHGAKSGKYVGYWTSYEANLLALP